MVLKQIGVRTAYDKEQEAHDAALMEAIARESENPFQQCADAVFSSIAHVYTNYLYTTGVLLVGWTWWGLYPRYARFRHTHIMRFQRRRQVEFRRWFFATRHIPKWDKKYLQRLELPSFTPNSPPSSTTTTTAAAARATAGTSSSSIAVHCPSEGSVMPHVEDSASGAHTGTVLSVGRTAGASFAGGARGKMESTIADGVHTLNGIMQQQLSDGQLRSHSCIDTHILHKRVEELIGDARGVVVLKETHATRRSVPIGREVWWASQEEAYRRREWWFWMKILIAARILEDLLDMPDMPDFVQ